MWAHLLPGVEGFGESGLSYADVGLDPTSYRMLGGKMSTPENASSSE